MSGEVVHLPGAAMATFIHSLDRLAESGPVLIGGLAVMCRVGGEHRPTLDVDSAFHNGSDTPTTELLVSRGVARVGDAPQRVIVDDTEVDVIDTFPIEVDLLPDDASGRLFACAHRHAYEAATDVHLVGDDADTTIRVADVDSLIAMKAHALRHARPQRRATKRASDLSDVVRLAGLRRGPILDGSPWDLRGQVRQALAEDLADVGSAAALLRRNPVQAGPGMTVELLELIVSDLLDRLA